uniref:Uncharacterized protein n=1 Tax=Brassica oleracea var. oleracea TaxID=109376 RepID=A0A0D3BWG5_BRAOL
MQKRVEAVDINGSIISCNFARYLASSTKFGLRYRVWSHFEQQSVGFLAKISTKKNNKNLEENEKLSYVHVRARSGEATDSHSLAERVT